MTMELGGRVTIECEKNNLQAELEFKLKVAPWALGGLGLERGEARPGGPPAALSVPGVGFLSRGTRAGSSGPSCSTAGACEGRREGKGLPAEPGEVRARPHRVAWRPGREPAPRAPAGPWACVAAPAVHRGGELEPP